MSLYSDLILRDRPVAYWQMGEASGSLTDSSGNGNTGTAHGTLTYGQAGAGVGLGNSIKFDGSTGYFSVPDAASLRLTGDMTDEAWVMPTHLANGSRFAIIDKEAAGGITTPAPYSLYILSFATTVNAEFSRGNGTVGATKQNNTALTLNAWNHVVFTQAGTTVHWFTNGVPINSGTLSTTIADNGDPLAIGATPVPSRFWFGNMQHVAIYNKALTAAQIAEHYNAGVRAFMLDSRPSRGFMCGPNRGAMRVAQAGVA